MDLDATQSNSHMMMYVTKLLYSSELQQKHSKSTWRCGQDHLSTFLSVVKWRLHRLCQSGSSSMTCRSLGPSIPPFMGAQLIYARINILPVASSTHRTEFYVRECSHAASASNRGEGARSNFVLQRSITTSKIRKEFEWLKACQPQKTSPPELTGDNDLDNEDKKKRKKVAYALGATAHMNVAMKGLAEIERLNFTAGSRSNSI